MAEDKVELREINYRQVFPWTELFKGFQLALDPKKLLLAAAEYDMSQKRDNTVRVSASAYGMPRVAVPTGPPTNSGEGK